MIHLQASSANSILPLMKIILIVLLPGKQTYSDKEKGIVVREGLGPGTPGV